jgi:hypothetical protein
LALVTLSGLVAPAGPREGLDRIGRRRVALLVTTMVLLVAMRVLGHQYATAYWLVLALLVLGTVLACRPETTEGRRAIILLATPMVPPVVGAALVALFPSAVRWIGHGALGIVAFSGPVLLAVACAATVRRVTRLRATRS